MDDCREEVEYRRTAKEARRGSRPFRGCLQDEEMDGLVGSRSWRKEKDERRAARRARRAARRMDAVKRRTMKLEIRIASRENVDGVMNARVDNGLAYEDQFGQPINNILWRWSQRQTHISNASSLPTPLNLFVAWYALSNELSIVAVLQM